MQNELFRFFKNNGREESERISFRMEKNQGIDDSKGEVSLSYV
jgi:hypothetical protein